ncbi:MAG: hypothetical protein DCC71_04685 [Proteobacteria bacterium]|nr:MAG: hypothetical protein DCC71_04685 [Pseudomonadota bacterium]
MRRFALAAALLLAFAPATSPAQEDDESAAVADLMQGLANGLAKKTNSVIAKEVMGWTLTSLGLQSGSGADAAILDALAEIEMTLIEIETELEDVIEILEQQECQNAANVDAVRTALQAIDTWVGRGAAPAVDSYLDLVDDAQEGLEVTSRMETLFRKVLEGDPPAYPPLEQLLVGLDDALRDQASAVGVLSACGQLIDPPSDEWDDRPYFQQLDDLAGYYAEYQARGALLLTEAYHWRALEAWLAAGNDPGSLAQEQVPSICAEASGDVLTWCVEAEDGFANVRTNLRAQYGELGAPYGSGPPSDPDADFDYDPDDPVVQVRNPSGFVWVKDVDDFFAKGGYATSCQESTSHQPCGPGVGPYDHASFEQYGSGEPIRYGANGGYTTWRPAPASEWTALAQPWSGSGTTFAQLLTDTHGLAGAETARVYFTGDVDASGHDVKQENVVGSNEWHFLATKVACFR